MESVSDRELLELAAKAVGFIDDATDESEAYGLHLASDGVFYVTSIYGWREWSPLTDDGDALRLAVKLKLTICIHWNSSRAVHSLRWEGDCAEEKFVPKVEGVDLAATRRAIVCAAAEIGRAKL